MPSVQYRDPFNATLLNSPALLVTGEQEQYIREVLDVCSSDKQFALKAYNAIHHILTAEPVLPPTVTSLVPATAAVGDPSFTLQVMGTGFNPGSIIMFNGLNENTTYVSPTEVSTGVDMSVWLAAAVCPVSVMTDGVISDPLDFTFTDAAAGGLSASKGGKTEVKKEEKSIFHPTPTPHVDVKNEKK